MNWNNWHMPKTKHQNSTMEGVMKERMIAQVPKTQLHDKFTSGIR